MKTVYNFNAGPCILPKEALQAGINALQDFNGSGMSVIEISHRSKDWEAVMNECRALWRELLQIPDNYDILFLGGGASLQFCMVPMNLMENKAAYLDTGVWAKKAYKEAKNLGNAVCVASSSDKELHLYSKRIRNTKRCGLLPYHNPTIPFTAPRSVKISTARFPWLRTCRQIS
jgi:phosphoserine aminotransferase